MTAHLDLQKPLTFGSRLIEGKDGDPPFTTLDIGTPGLRAVVYVTTRAEADALVKAALAARDLLPGPEPCGDIAEHTRETCELAPGHDGWHRSGQITWPWADEAAPGPTVAGHCPICGGQLAADGSHISATSGAHIPAEPAEVRS